MLQLGASDVNGAELKTTTNTAYVQTKCGRRLEDDYDLISPPESHFGGYVNVVPLPPHLYRQPLPALSSSVAIPPAETTDRAEEVMYEQIPGDK